MSIDEEAAIVADINHLIYKFRRLIEIYGDGIASEIVAEAYSIADEQVKNKK